MQSTRCIYRSGPGFNSRRGMEFPHSLQNPRLTFKATAQWRCQSAVSQVLSWAIYWTSSGQPGNGRVSCSLSHHLLKLCLLPNSIRNLIMNCITVFNLLLFKKIIIEFFHKHRGVYFFAFFMPVHLRQIVTKGIRQLLREILCTWIIYEAPLLHWENYLTLVPKH